MTQDLKRITDSMLFFSKMSHELRTPIHGITGLSEYLRDNWNNLDTYKKKSCINDLYSSVFDITELIEKLFQLTSLSSDVRYNFEKTNVVELMETVVEQNNRFMHNASYTSLILESDEQEILINVDPFWIRQLLSNLINNAIKHSGATNIKIKINWQELSSKKNLVISVVDDGCGIPQKDLDTLFTPFQQGSNINETLKGSGLGLSICKEIVAAHDGEIWIKNNYKKGVSVSFSLPKSEASL
jgi:K+-sensing histidine kinase KdpD